jgi:hypothetical protein
MSLLAHHFYLPISNRRGQGLRAFKGAKFRFRSCDVRQLAKKVLYSPIQAQRDSPLHLALPMSNCNNNDNNNISTAPCCRFQLAQLEICSCSQFLT